MLYLIGLGLWDEKDVSIKGKEIIEKCDKIYLENYTSILNINKEKLEEYYGKEIMSLEREDFEPKISEMIEEARNKNISVLVIGDALSATTHISLIQEAKEKDVEFKVIHNASIFTAVSITGLELYKFGKTTSIPFDHPDLETPYNVLKKNLSLGLHTLFLLDLKPFRGKFMTVNDAIGILLEIEGRKRENIINPETQFIGCARLGGDYKIVYGTSEELKSIDFGEPLHCLIVPGKLHFVEEDMLNLWRIK